MSSHASSAVDAPARKRTFRFVYRNSVALVGISVAWFVASLPLVTVGPATLGAYAAVRSLRETGRLDRARVLAVVRTNGIHAAALSFLPIVVFASAVLSLRSGVDLGAVGTAVVVGGLYLGSYLVVALIPTFVALAAGESPISALREGYLWVAGHPAMTLVLGFATAFLFVATALTTVGFVLLFAGVTFSYHVELLADGNGEASTPEPAGRAVEDVV